MTLDLFWTPTGTSTSHKAILEFKHGRLDYEFHLLTYHYQSKDEAGIDRYSFAIYEWGQYYVASGSGYESRLRAEAAAARAMQAELEKRDIQLP